MLWKEPIDHHFTNCYFCAINTYRFSGKSKCNIEYPNVSSATYPQNHNEFLPVPKPPKFPQEDNLFTGEFNDSQSTNSNFNDEP